MSSSEVEPAKLLLPYLQRADELQKHDPLVAYYCRLFAMERGLKIPPKERTKMTNSLLVSLMNQLEKDKKSVKVSADDNLHIEGFALNLFAKADKQDRAGRADLSTAKTFYAASIFFEILYQFGEIQPDLEQKQKYAVWKAADIRKALKEGRKPNPGPPIGDDELGLSSGVQSSGGDYGQVESLSRSQSMQQGSTSSFQDHYQPPPALQKQTSFPSSNSTSSDYNSNDYSQSRYQHPPPNMSRTSSYQQPYEPPPPRPEEQNRAPPIQPGYVGQDMANPYSYPSFQYPSPAESFPTAGAGSYMNPTALSGTYSSYYQSSESGLTSGGYAQQPATSVPEPVTQQYSSSQSGTYVAKPSKGDYVYDSNYQPPPEKIAEAHKAARFAVGALAFDDVSVAIEHLRSSLELLTKPSASAHSHSS